MLLFSDREIVFRNNFPIALNVVGGKLVVTVGFPTGTYKKICAQELLTKHRFSV